MNKLSAFIILCSMMSMGVSQELFAGRDDEGSSPTTVAVASPYNPTLKLNPSSAAPVAVSPRDAAAYREMHPMIAAATGCKLEDLQPIMPYEDGFQWWNQSHQMSPEYLRSIDDAFV